jgi:hypothetical protein
LSCENSYPHVLGVKGAEGWRWGPKTRDLSVYGGAMGLGNGKTEHAGARDMTRKRGHWGFTEGAKAWASRARRRDEKDELAAEFDDVMTDESE